MIEIRIEPPPNLQSMINRISVIPGALEKAGKRAVKRTLVGGKRDARAKIAQRYTIAVGKVTSRLKIKQNGLSGEMSATGRRQTLKNFIIRPSKRQNPGPPGGVFAQVVKGQGGYIRRAFINKDGNVFEREGRPRYPIRILTGPSVPGMLSNAHVGPYIENKMFERLEINLTHEINAIIGGFG